MSYQIRITKIEPNPEIEKFREDESKRRYPMYEETRHPGYIREEIVKDVLMVELTDEQYKKVKAEVIKAFE